MKLIRDRTPDLERGSTRPVRNVDEFLILLRSKLMEEAAETAASTSREEFVKEMGDLYEVMLTLASKMGIDFDNEVIVAAVEKYLRKGGFENGLVLVHDPLSNKVMATI